MYSFAEHFSNTVYNDDSQRALRSDARLDVGGILTKKIRVFFTNHARLHGAV